jgi:hypothetical protein
MRYLFFIILFVTNVIVLQVMDLSVWQSLGLFVFCFSSVMQAELLQMPSNKPKPDLGAYSEYDHERR